MNEISDKIFWDSNLWLYVFVNGTTPEDITKKTVLLDLLEQDYDLFGSVQVLNEVGNVLLRKYKYSEITTKESLEVIDDLRVLIPLTKDLPLSALEIKAKYKFSWFDSLIIAAALKSKCTFLYTEDLHHGLVIEDTLVIVNPFKLNLES